MDQDTVIKVENISKKFSKSLKRSMFYGILDIGKNAVGIKAKSDKLRKGEFWAVKDVSFELKRGEVLGIIGSNGSGKTTLLKMLNGIFWPDKGKITINGKVGALIAAGVGFHPHLTGRENIYINGAILGMSKKEIDKKIDRIIEFADIGNFIDTPVKFYSSGMMVRLGFSSAIFIEPEILLIDEILAVGDINFRKKAAEKLQQLRNKTSTIFISHNLREISRVCDRAIWLDNGKIIETGLPDKVINSYINFEIQPNIKQDSDISVLKKIDDINGIKIKLIDKNNIETRSFSFGDPLQIEMDLDVSKEIKDIVCNIVVLNPEGNIITMVNNDNNLLHLKPGKNYIKGKFEEIKMLPGRYNLKIRFTLGLVGKIADINCGTIFVNELKGNIKPIQGIYRENFKWDK